MSLVPLCPRCADVAAVSCPLADQAALLDLGPFCVLGGVLVCEAVAEMYGEIKCRNDATDIKFSLLKVVQ